MVTMAVSSLLFGVVTVGKHQSEVGWQEQGVLHIGTPVQIVGGTLQRDIAVVAETGLDGHAPPLGDGDGQEEIEIGEAVLHPIHIRLPDVGVAANDLCVIVFLYPIVAPGVSDGKIIFAQEQPRELEVVAVVGPEGRITLHDDIAGSEVARWHQLEVAHALGTSCETQRERILP